MATSSSAKQFPGFGLPVTHKGARGSDKFPLAIDGRWSSDGVTLREKRMLDFIGKITDKPGWETKVFDAEIVSRWRAEADGLTSDDGDVYLSQEMFDFCIAELRDKSAHFKETGRVNVLDSELNIVKSDSAVPKEVQDELRAAVKVLEDVPDRLKDWHPGSDDLVLDLVHPSLFPVVWGLTRALEEGTVPLEDCIKYTGKGAKVAEHIPQPAGDRRWDAPELWSSHQWLPAEVGFGADGAVKITSYINNLHPVKHKALYSVLERIAAATLRVWDDSLSGFADRRRFLIAATSDNDYELPPGLKYRIPGREGPKAWIDPATYDGGGLDDDGDDDNDANDDWEDDFYEWKLEHRILTYPEPREYKLQAELQSGDRVALREQFPNGVQVIFKLANIHLTPEKPSYAGGSWHVEGTMNEMIVASAIYYYDQDNITDSFLAFRQAVNHEDLTMIPDQNEHKSLEAYLGVEQDGPAVQDLGQVLTREGRLLAFPNCVQHQVQPFSLQDATRPGHRKILAMFLVNPQRPILSSAHVPPQRRDWWAEEVRANGGLDKLPAEIFDLAVDMVDEFPISWEKALEIRKELMDERGTLNTSLTEYIQAQTFSFCEH